MSKGRKGGAPRSERGGRSRRGSRVLLSCLSFERENHTKGQSKRFPDKRGEENRLIGEEDGIFVNAGKGGKEGLFVLKILFWN